MDLPSPVSARTLLSCATETPPFESDCPGYLIRFFTLYDSGNVLSPRSAFRKNLVRLAELDSRYHGYFLLVIFLCTEADCSVCKLPVVHDEFASMLWCFSWYGSGSWIKSSLPPAMWFGGFSITVHDLPLALVWFGGLSTTMPKSVFVTHVRRVGGRD